MTCFTGVARDAAREQAAAAASAKSVPTMSAVGLTANCQKPLSSPSNSAIRIERSTSFTSRVAFPLASAPGAISGSSPPAGVASAVTDEPAKSVIPTCPTVPRLVTSSFSAITAAISQSMISSSAASGSPGF